MDAHILTEEEQKVIDEMTGSEQWDLVVRSIRAVGPKVFSETLKATREKLTWGVYLNSLTQWPDCWVQDDHLSHLDMRETEIRRFTKEGAEQFSIAYNDPELGSPLWCAEVRQIPPV